MVRDEPLLSICHFLRKIRAATTKPTTKQPPPIKATVKMSKPTGGACVVVVGVVPVVPVVPVVVGAKPPGTYGTPFHIDATGGATVE